MRGRLRLRLVAAATAVWILLIAAPLSLRMPPAFQGPRLWGHLLAGLAGLAAIGLVNLLLARSESRLGESQSVQRALLEGLPDGVARFDREGRHLFVSRNVEQVVDLPAERFLGRTHRELGFPEELCRFWGQAIRRVFDSGAPHETEFCLRTMKGERVFNWRLVPERTARGEVRSVLTIARDETARRRAEQDYQTLFREMLGGFAVHELLLDPRGEPADYRVLLVNPAFERLTGLRAEQVVGRTARELDPGAEPRHLQRFARVVASGQPATFQEHYAGLDKHLELTAFRTAPGQFACILTDVSERVRAQGELRLSARRFREIFDESPISIWEEDFSAVRAAFQELRAAGVSDFRAHLQAHPEEVARLAGLVRIVEFNKASVGLLGASSKEEVLRELPRCFTQASLEVFREEMVTLAEGGTRFESEVPIVDVAGRPRTLELRLAVLPGHESSLARVFVSFLDVSARRLAEEEREKLRQQLMQTQRMESVGRLAGGVAHDFNNMLGVILGHAELALGRVGSQDPLRSGLEQIQLAAQRSADLTGQLLAFARRQMACPRVVDLNGLVEGMLRMLRRLIGEGIELSWEPGGGLWPVRIDPSQVDQIVANLCVNARDAIAGSGRIGIHTANSELDDAYCSRHPGARPGPHVLLSVSDDGCGMDRGTLEHLFEPFFTTKGVGRGTGLGLATVYGIVKQNQGYIEVTSSLGTGTSFRIFLPRHGGRDPEQAQERAAAPRGRGETVLLVEDEPLILEMGRSMLERLGYRVLAAGGLQEALRLAAGGPIQLLLTDVIMPRLNGWDLARRLRQERPELKCLFMSGYATDVLAPGLPERVHFLPKPFSLQDLAVRVREALDGPPTDLTRPPRRG